MASINYKKWAALFSINKYNFRGSDEPFERTCILAVFTLIGLLIYSKKTGVELGLQKNNVFENLKNEPEWLTKIKELDNGKALCSDWDLERIPDVQELGDASAIDYGDEFIALCYEHDLMDFDIDPKDPLVNYIVNKSLPPKPISAYAVSINSYVIGWNYAKRGLGTIIQIDEFDEDEVIMSGLLLSAFSNENIHFKTRRDWNDLKKYWGGIQTDYFGAAIISSQFDFECKIDLETLEWIDKSVAIIPTELASSPVKSKRIWREKLHNDGKAQTIISFTADLGYLKKRVWNLILPDDQTVSTFIAKNDLVEQSSLTNQEKEKEKLSIENEKQQFEKRLGSILMIDADKQLKEEGIFSLFSQKHIDAIEKIIAGKTCTDFSSVITKQELIAGKWNLCPKRYVGNSKKIAISEKLKLEGIPLQSFVNFIRCSPLITNDLQQGERVFEANVSDINEIGILEEPAKTSILSDLSQESDRVAERVKSQQLKKFDIVIALKGNAGKIGLVYGNPENPWFAGQSFCILRPKFPEKPESTSMMIYLFRFLRSSFIQAYFSKLKSAQAHKTLAISDLKNIPIINPSYDMFSESYANFDREIEIMKEIKKLKSELSEIKNDSYLEKTC